METPLLPTSYLPPISYMALLLHHGCATIEHYETYPKQTCRNRTTILSANGLLRLSVPVVKTNGNHTLTKDIAITYVEHWQLQHVRAIESAYSTSPFFIHYWEPLREIILKEHESLCSLNHELLDRLLLMMKIDCTVNPSSDYVHSAPKDFRDIFSRPTPSLPQYYQVWSDRLPFASNISILDLLFNLGHIEAKEYLRNITPQILKTLETT